MSVFIQAVLWVAYVVLPARVGGLVDGAPLGMLDSCALAAVLWLTCRRRPIAGGRIVAAVAVITALAHAAVPDRGFRARYFADAEARGAIELSTEYQSSIFTRVDDRLDFSPRKLDFPLAFFNDIARFNFGNPSEPDRQRLPFAVAWDGQWLVAGHGATGVYLDAPGASADLALDGARVVSVTPARGMTAVAVAVPPGWHHIEIRFSSPYGSPRRFSAGEVVAGRPVPFDTSGVATRRLDPWQIWLERLLKWIRTTCDAVALTWLAVLLVVDLRDLRRGRRAGGAAMRMSDQFLSWFVLVALVDAFFFAAPWLTKLATLAAGDDSLTYETYARSIQLTGPLLRSIEGPFYYQVLYPYFIAAIHSVFGESMFGVVLVQRLLVAFSVWMAVDIARQIAGERIWPAAFVCAWLVAYVKFAPIAAGVLSESFFVPLLLAWTAALMRAARSPGTRRVAATGVLGGIAALTRSTALLAWAAALPAIWRGWRRVPARRTLVATLLACSLAVFALITVRNLIVAHRFVPTPTEFSVTLLGGNEPPKDVTLDLARRGALYDRLGINSLSRQVVEYAIAAPGTFAANLGRKFLFAIGIYEPYAPGFGHSLLFFAMTVLGVLGFAIALRSAAVPPAIVCLPGLVALSQFVAVVIVYPKHERLILPFHMMWTPYAAVALDRAFRARRMLSAARPPLAGRFAGALGVAALAIYTFVIRTRGITDHFLMLNEQIRDWKIALGPASQLPLVGTPSTAGGRTFGPIFYWVLWLIRVIIGPFAANLPHAGGLGLSALQSMADVVLCVGIWRASRSWLFALATVLIVASSPFDLALSSVIWNPVLAVVFAKIGIGLVLAWQDDLTRPRRLAIAAVAWLAVQSHSAALPIALALFAWIFWTGLRRGSRAFFTTLAEAAVVVAILQIPAALSSESIRPTKIQAVIQDQQPLRVVDAFRAVTDAVGAIGLAPFDVPQPTLLLLGAVAAILVVAGPLRAIAAVTAVPLALTVAMWSIWQQVYDAYVFLTIVPAALLAVVWSSRLLPDRSARVVLAAALLVAAVAVQRPRMESAALVFRMQGYGALVRGSRAIVERGAPVRAIEVPFLHPLSDPEYLFTVLGGHFQRDAPTVARIAENGDVTYVR